MLKELVLASVCVIALSSVSVAASEVERANADLQYSLMGGEVGAAQSPRSARGILPGAKEVLNVIFIALDFGAHSQAQIDLDSGKFTQPAAIMPGLGRPHPRTELGPSGGVSDDDLHRGLGSGAGYTPPRTQGRRRSSSQPMRAPGSSPESAQPPDISRRGVMRDLYREGAFTPTRRSDDDVFSSGGAVAADDSMQRVESSELMVPSLLTTPPHPVFSSRTRAPLRTQSPATAVQTDPPELAAQKQVERAHDLYYDFMAYRAAATVFYNVYTNKTDFAAKLSAPFSRMNENLERREWVPLMREIADAVNAAKDPLFGTARAAHILLNRDLSVKVVTWMGFDAVQIAAIQAPLSVSNARIYYVSDTLNSIMLVLDHESFAKKFAASVATGNYFGRESAVMSLFSPLRGFIRVGALIETVRESTSYVFRSAKLLRFSSMITDASLIHFGYHIASTVTPWATGATLGAGVGAFVPYALNAMHLNIGGVSVGPAMGAIFGAQDTGHDMFSLHTILAAGGAQAATYLYYAKMHAVCLPILNLGVGSTAVFGPLGLVFGGLAYGACMSIPAVVGGFAGSQVAAAVDYVTP